MGQQGTDLMLDSSDNLGRFAEQSCTTQRTGINLHITECAGTYSLTTLGAWSIAVVPIPAAAWLFGSALGVMGWMRRKIGS